MLNLFIVHYRDTYVIDDRKYFLDIKVVFLADELFCFALETFLLTVGLFNPLFCKLFALKYLFVDKGSFNSEK